MRRLLVLLALVLAAATATARADVLTGVTGGAQPYARQTGTHPQVLGFFTQFGAPSDAIFAATEQADAAPMLHVGTNDGYGTRETITPRGIARGRGDAYLVGLNRRLAAYGKRAYVRLMAEMNQANNAYSAFDANGTSRGAAHSTRSFRRAWRRSALILRGGRVAAMDARLRRWHLPPVRTAADALPAPQVELLWIPQTRGTPDIPANLPQRYWPGRRYVDWVGTDFYSRFPRFDWLTAFYHRFRGTPFAFGEWALWGADDPAFVRRFFRWVHRHRRAKLLLYNQGGTAGGPFRLDRYPRARAEIARQLGRL